MFQKKQKSFIKGNDPWFIYIFLVLHGAVFTSVSFYLIYWADKSEDPYFGYIWGGIGAIVYSIIYFGLFAKEKLLWAFINGTIAFFQILSIRKSNSFFEELESLPWYTHIVPIIYFVLYTFLLRHICLKISSAISPKFGIKIGNTGFVLINIGVWYWIQTF